MKDGSNGKCKKLLECKFKKFINLGDESDFVANSKCSFYEDVEIVCCPENTEDYLDNITQDTIKLKNKTRPAKKGLHQ